MDGSVHCFMLCINAIDDTFHHDVLDCSLTTIPYKMLFIRRILTYTSKLTARAGKYRNFATQEMLSSNGTTGTYWSS
jgi:hypothetical protein